MELDFSCVSKSSFCGAIREGIKRPDRETLEYINKIINPDSPLRQLRVSLCVRFKRMVFELYDSDGELEDEYEYHVQGSIPKMKEMTKDIDRTITGIGYYISHHGYYPLGEFGVEKAYSIIKLEGGVLDLVMYNMEPGADNGRSYEKIELDKEKRDKIVLYLYPHLSRYYKGKTIMDDFLSSFIIAQRDMMKYVASVADKLDILAGCIDELKDYIKERDGTKERNDEISEYLH